MLCVSLVLILVDHGAGTFIAFNRRSISWTASLSSTAHLNICFTILASCRFISSLRLVLLTTYPKGAVEPTHFPDLAAFIRPLVVLSRIISFSNSAKVPTKLKLALPNEVVVSNGSVTERKATPKLSSSWMMFTSMRRLRAKRSVLYTTTTSNSPRLAASNNALRPGRFSTGSPPDISSL